MTEVKNGKNANVKCTPLTTGLWLTIEQSVRRVSSNKSKSGMNKFISNILLQIKCQQPNTKNGDKHTNILLWNWKRHFFNKEKKHKKGGKLEEGACPEVLALFLFCVVEAMTKRRAVCLACVEFGSWVLGCLWKGSLAKNTVQHQSF